MYEYFNKNPQGNYQAGDCAIRAISIVTGDSWEDIYDDLCDEGKYLGDWGNNNGVWATKSEQDSRHILLLLRKLIHQCL